VFASWREFTATVTEWWRTDRYQWIGRILCWREVSEASQCQDQWSALQVVPLNQRTSINILDSALLMDYSLLYSGDSWHSETPSVRKQRSRLAEESKI